MSLTKSILTKTQTIAIVGLSNNPDRPSNEVAKFLIGKGFQIIPVNPNETKILDQICYPSLLEIPYTIDMVNVFRKSEDCPPIASQAVQINAKVLWLQLGVISEEAENIAKKSGLEYISDRCLKIEYLS